MLKYKVEVPYLRPLVIEATSPEDAWEKYKVAQGLIRTVYKPKITEFTEDADCPGEPDYGEG